MIYKKLEKQQQEQEWLQQKKDINDEEKIQSLTRFPKLHIKSNTLIC